MNFKVKVTPTLVDKGKYIKLVGVKTLTAKDEYTGEEIRVKAKEDDGFIDQGNVPYGSGTVK
jgi:hypothetical protein